jgi:hypothetical protein
MTDYIGTIVKLSTDPRTVKIRTSDGPPPVEPIFSPLTADQWTLLCSTPDGKTVTVTAPGTGVTPTSVSRP